MLQSILELQHIRVQKNPWQIVKGLAQQYDHPSVGDQQCTAFPNPTGVLSASRLEGGCPHLGRRVCAPTSSRPSHPTIGHRHQCNLRLYKCVSRGRNSKGMSEPFRIRQWKFLYVVNKANQKAMEQVGDLPWVCWIFLVVHGQRTLMYPKGVQTVEEYFQKKAQGESEHK